MEDDKFTNALAYVMLLSTFFIILFVLDRIFGIKYEPDQLRLNRPRLEYRSEPTTYEEIRKAEAALDSAEATMETAEPEKETTEESTSEETAAGEGHESYLQIPNTGSSSDHLDDRHIT